MFWSCDLEQSARLTYIHDAVLLWVEEEPVIKEGQLGIRSSHV